MPDTIIINCSFYSALNCYEEYVDNMTIFRDLPNHLKLLRRILLGINSKFARLFYKKEWENYLDNFDVVLLFDSIDYQYISRKIELKYPNKRLVYFLWNSIVISKLPSLSSNWEIWTSDHNDAIKFGFKYAGQFIFERFIRTENVKEEKYDLYFVGIDKGRFKHLIEMKNNFSCDYRLFFRLVSRYKCLFSNLYSHPISYDKVLSEAAQSKAILEYNQSSQKGLTLRSVESIVMNKKLVSNNVNIKNFSFFSDTNCFILENDDLSGLSFFLSIPMKPYPIDLVKKYYFTSWLERIKMGIEMDDVV